MYCRKVCKLAIGSIILLRKTSTRSRLRGYAKRPLDLCAPLFQLLFWSISHDGSGVLMPTKNMTFKNGNGLITMKLQKGDCKIWTCFLFRTPWKIKGWNKKNGGLVQMILLSQIGHFQLPKALIFPGWCFQSSRLGFQQSLFRPQKWSGSDLTKGVVELGKLGGHYWWQCFKE